MNEEIQNDVAISLQIPADLVKKIDDLAKAEMRSRNKQFVFLLTEYFENRG
jgi:hypothetical protein